MKFMKLLMIVALLGLASCAPATATDVTVESADVTVEATPAVAATNTIPPVVAATDAPASSPTSGPTQPPALATTTIAAIAPTTTTVPTSTPSTEVQPPSTTAPITAPQATADSGQPSPVVFGRTEEGAYFHGAADAPVTLLDYSDFL